MKKPKLFYIKIYPYDQDVLIILGGDIDDVINLMKDKKRVSIEKGKKNIEKLEEYKNDLIEKGDYPQRSRGCTYPLPYGAVISFEDLKPDKYTVMHEGVHLIDSIFEKCGVPITKDNEEARAYHLEDFVKRFDTNFNRKENLYKK